MENQEKQKILRKTIQKLPKMERSVIFMRYFQNLKHQEVALSLGITQAGSKFLQRSAHTHMRELLKKEGISSWGILIPFFLRCPALRLPGQKSPENTKFTAAAGHTGISSIAAAAGMFAAVVCTGSLAGAPVINSIKLPSGLTKAPAKVEVRVRTPFPVSEIRMDNGSALPVFGKRTSPDSYAVYVRENGDYTVKIKTNNGKSTSETVKISCIDSGRPEASCTLENGKLYASVWDDESGIDFASLYCDTEDRTTIYPEHIDRQAGLAVFPLPREDVTLRLRDNAGNKGKMLITYAH